ncbi:hypothetical protein PV682_34610 [Streptomyces niveiscabiei]|uniref:hypothetical protein n=1 Tax=Streptomyces niveiscabiei TaxID=164115 RepID=UPI0029B295C5|nr:hypothetical protein [Streptomyces niveiscabiei]MDX3386543.1 hypothetical protein [Streptomyces niveiscabiei]
MNNSTPYPQEFIKPEIIDDCDDCKVFVDKWFRHMNRKSENYDPSAASDAAVLWKMHVTNTHPGTSK